MYADVFRRCSCVGAKQRSYTQFAIQDSGLFGPNPWKILAPPSNYLSKEGFWATQPLEQILVAEFLLCELGVRGFDYNFAKRMFRVYNNKFK